MSTPKDTREIAKEIVDLLSSYECSYVAAKDVMTRIEEIFANQPVQLSSTAEL